MIFNGKTNFRLGHFQVCKLLSSLPDGISFTMEKWLTRMRGLKQSRIEGRSGLNHQTGYSEDIGFKRGITHVQSDVKQWIIPPDNDDNSLRT